jgi:hypothetical protein
LILCWARTRFLSHAWGISPYHWNDIEESDNNDNKRSNDRFEFMERAAIPLFMKARKTMRSGSHHSHEDLREKLFGEATKLQGGRSLHGLWAMPGRR